MKSADFTLLYIMCTLWWNGARITARRLTRAPRSLSSHPCSFLTLSTLTYLRRGKPHQSYSVNQLRSQTLSPWLSQDTTVGTSHKAQMIGTTRLLYTLRPLVHSASYRPGRATTNLIMNLGVSHSHEASIGSIDSLDHWFPMYLSRLGSGLEAFSHNP